MITKSSDASVAIQRTEPQGQSQEPKQKTVGRTIRLPVQSADGFETKRRPGLFDYQQPSYRASQNTRPAAPSGAAAVSVNVPDRAGGTEASTEAVGEEDGGPLATTLAMGEEDNWGNVGGEHDDDGPIMSTQAVGEEDGGPIMSTQAVGEEDGGPIMSTQAVGEEDGGPIMSTQAVGEEDGGSAPR